ncbi:hypothetical protein RSJ22_12800 [Clostridium botulinum]|uniref:hypothetical protein n=1 Tax=Clostridium botulinum TaxID=1491 RepID=UPI000C785139|nr:hypothetical protein [Clostridium botulinum]AUN22266.1 hypothetical protein RSJ22_12800 [Clostridium botulinum]
MPLRYELWQVIKLISNDNNLKFKSQTDKGDKYIIQVNNNKLNLIINNKINNQIAINLLWEMI